MSAFDWPVTQRHVLYLETSAFDWLMTQRHVLYLNMSAFDWPVTQRHIRSYTAAETSKSAVVESLEDGGRACFDCLVLWLLWR
jgi:aspartate/methionine/tyrosine aminotransferase